MVEEEKQRSKGLKKDEEVGERRGKAGWWGERELRRERWRVTFSDGI